MARFIDLSIIGHRRLQRKLSKMEPKIIKRVVKKGMVKALKPVEVEAKKLAPFKTGALQKSIKTIQYSSRHSVGGAVKTGTRKQLKIDPNSKGYYPAAHEYGSQYLPARSFMRKALYRKRKQALSILAVSIRQVLKEESAK